MYALSNILGDQIDNDGMDGTYGEFRVTYKIAFGAMTGRNGKYNGRWEASCVREEFKENLLYDLGSCVSRLIQYQALADMTVKIACPLRAEHSFSDALLRCGCALTNGVIVSAGSSISWD
jgi:hypothetical protein